MKDPMLGLEMDETVQFIPVRYNRQSELKAEVTEVGPTYPPKIDP